MKEQRIKKRLLYLCLVLILALSLAACGGKANEPDTTADIKETQAMVPAPAPAPAPEPEPEPEPPIPYTDVPEDASCYDKVVWAYENGIASDGSAFEPDAACTRAQVVTFLWRAAGAPEPQTAENPFSDISSSAWYYTAVLWAYENNIVTSTTFNPDISCNNAAALTFLWRAEGKPAAAVYNSPAALAAPDAYYARPVAWAENNGMFDGMDSAFSADALCRRADIVAYLYWAREQWTFTEEDKTVQAEYEQIVNDAKPYEVYGSGLIYADYVDVDGDGKVELLTFDSGKNLIDDEVSLSYGYRYYDVTAIVYANINGHAGKACEYTFEPWVNYGYTMYLCTYNNNICFRAECGMRMYGEHDEYYIIENGEIKYYEYADDVYYMDSPDEGPVVKFEGIAGDITEDEYNAIRGKYENQKEIYHCDSSSACDGVTVYDCGMLLSPAEYWINYWAEHNPPLAAALKGDFSAFAGTYTYARNSPYGGTPDIILDKDGIPTGEYVANQKPISISINKEGTITCELPPEEDNEDGEIFYLREYYVIYPVGIAAYDFTDSDYQDDLSKVRIQYWYPSQGVDFDIFSRIS